MGGTGDLRAAVSPTNVKVEYVQTWIPSLEKGTTKNGMIAGSYTIPARKTNLKFTSAASYAGGNVAPESILAANGIALGNSQVVVKDSTGAERNAVVLGAAAAEG